jgi:hypothetical protein
MARGCILRVDLIKLKSNTYSLLISLFIRARLRACMQTLTCSCVDTVHETMNASIKGQLHCGTVDAHLVSADWHVRSTVYEHKAHKLVSRVKVSMHGSSVTALVTMHRPSKQYQVAIFYIYISY